MRCPIIRKTPQMPDTLPDRIESAACGSRELDAEIFNALATAVHHEGGWTHLEIGGRMFHADREAPAYTTSIDAAMTLVPEEMRDEIEIVTLYRVARVTINMNHTPDSGPFYGSNEANSIPLALCAAALRARKDG
jgi:hypothetical protein